MDLKSPGIQARIAAAQGQADIVQAERARLNAGGERADRGDKDPAALRKAAEQFEAVFLNTLMKAMRNTVPENELMNGGGATKFYRQMHDAEMANSLARSNGGLGIADMIVRQLERTEGGEESGGPEIGPPAPAQGSVSGSSRHLVLRRLAADQSPAVGDTLRRFEPEIHSAARSSGLDPALLLAVVMEESGGDPEALSSKGALGLMQLMPATADELGVEDRTSPAQNLRGGADYLAKMIRGQGGDLERALAAYNAGPGTVARAGGRVPDYPETRRYVRRVIDRYRALAGGTQLANGQ